MKLTKKCACCGKEFEKHTCKSLKDWLNRSKFCSKECINKGRKHTQKWKQKMSDWHKENPNSGLFQKGIISRNKGKKLLYITAGKHPKWKGGRILRPSGYVLIYCPGHPNKTHKSYFLEHRLIMEKHLGRYLTRQEVVHHINGIREDNRIENLMLFPNNWAHMKFHRQNNLSKVF